MELVNFWSFTIFHRILETDSDCVCVIYGARVDCHNPGAFCHCQLGLVAGEEIQVIVCNSYIVTLIIHDSCCNIITNIWVHIWILPFRIAFNDVGLWWILELNRRITVENVYAEWECGIPICAIIGIACIATTSFNSHGIARATFTNSSYQTTWFFILSYQRLPIYTWRNIKFISCQRTESAVSCFKQCSAIVNQSKNRIYGSIVLLFNWKAWNLLKVLVAI